MPRSDSPPVTKGVVLRSLGFGLAVILGAIAVWLIVTGTNSPKRIEIGVLAGLWGLLLGAYTMFGSRRLGTPGDFGPPDPAGSELALRSSAEIERVAEAAVRRVFEEQLEGLLSRYINSSMSREVSDLRDEISRLRQDLVEKVGGQLRLERIETTRLIGSDLEALQHEVRKLTVANENVAPDGLNLERAGGQPRVTSVRHIVEGARVGPVGRPAADIETSGQPAGQSPGAATPVAMQKDATTRPGGLTKATASTDAASGGGTRSAPATVDARIAEPTAEAAKAQAARAEAALAEAAKAEARKAEAVKVAAAQAEEAKLEARRAETARVEAVRLEAQRVAAERLEARQAEVAKAEALQREARRAEAAKAEAARLEAQRAEAARLEARKAEVAKAEAARVEARKLSGARAAHAAATDETGPLGRGLPAIRSAAQRAAGPEQSRHGSPESRPVEVQPGAAPASVAAQPAAAPAPVAAQPGAAPAPVAAQPAAAPAPVAAQPGAAPASVAAQPGAAPAPSAQPAPPPPAVSQLEPALASHETSAWPARPGASDDPFASLPRITPFTAFALDPIEPTNSNWAAAKQIGPDGVNGDSVNGDSLNGDSVKSDSRSVYTGRRRRSGDSEPIVDERGRHARGDAPPDPEPEPPVRRRRRADENDDGEDLLARLLAARNKADH